MPLLDDLAALLEAEAQELASTRLALLRSEAGAAARRYGPNGRDLQTGPMLAAIDAMLPKMLERARADVLASVVDAARARRPDADA